MVGAHGELAVGEEVQCLLDRVHPPHRRPCCPGPRCRRRGRGSGGGGAGGRRGGGGGGGGLHLGARLEVDADAEEDVLRGEADRRQRVARRRRRGGCCGVRRHRDSVCLGWGWMGSVSGLGE